MISFKWSSGRHSWADCYFTRGNGIVFTILATQPHVCGLLTACQLPNSFYSKVKAGHRNWERLIPRKGLSFYPGSEVPASSTPHSMSRWPELDLEPIPRMITGPGDGIATPKLDQAWFIPRTRNRADFHWDRGPLSILKIRSLLAENKRRWVLDKQLCQPHRVGIVSPITWTVRQFFPPLHTGCMPSPSKLSLQFAPGGPWSFTTRTLILKTSIT